MSTSHPIDPEALLGHGPALRSLVRRLVVDAARADDVLQETWRAALERRPERGGDAGGWLAVVARNFALRSRRTDARVRVRETAAARPEAMSTDPDAAERAEELRRLSEAVARLREPLRTVIVQRYYEDRSERAIAAAHGVSRWQVGTWLGEAHADLRRSLDAGRGGDRAAWIVLLAPIAGRPSGAFAVGTTGGFVMGTKLVALAVGVMLGFGAGWVGRTLAAPAETDRAPETAAAPATSPATPARSERSPRQRAGTTSEAPAPATATSAAAPAPLDADAYLQRINDAADWKAAWAVTGELAARGDAGFEAFRAIYPRIADADRRAQGVKSFRESPRALDAFDLGMGDTAPRPRSFAEAYLREIALRDFSDAREDYAAWRAQNADRTPRDAFVASLGEFVRRVEGLRGEALASALAAADLRLDHTFGRFGLDGRRVAADSGLIPLVRAWISDPATPAEVRRYATEWLVHVPDADGLLRGSVLAAALDTSDDHSEVAGAAARTLGRAAPPWLVDVVAPIAHDATAPAGRRRAAMRVFAAAKLDRTALERVCLPILRDAAPDPECFNAACNLLGTQGKPWALQPLLDALVAAPTKKSWWAVAMGLAEVGDPAAIPSMIAVIEADGGGTYDSIYGVGYFGLGRLTGVRYDEKHDGAWWRDWWTREHGRFGAAGETSIASVRPRALDAERK